MSRYASHVGHAWNNSNEFLDQIQLDTLYSNSDPRALQQLVAADVSTQVAPTRISIHDPGAQAPNSAPNSWDYLQSINSLPSLNYRVPLSNYSPPLSESVSGGTPHGLPDIPTFPTHSSSHGLILESRLGTMPNGHYANSDVLESTLFRFGQVPSGPTFSPLVPPSISPRSHNSTSRNLKGKNVQRFDQTIFAPDPLLAGISWGHGETHTTGVSGQHASPHHTLHGHAQEASGVDIVNVSDSPCDALVPIPVPQNYGIDPSLLYRTNSQHQSTTQYQSTSNSVPQGNNNPTPPYRLGKRVDYLPISDIPLNPPLTAEEREWILCIERGMPTSSSTSQLVSDGDYAGPSFIPSSSNQDRRTTGVPLQLSHAQPDFPSALEHQACLSSPLDQDLRVNLPLAFDLGSIPQSSSAQHMGQASTGQGLINFSPSMALPQTPIIAPSNAWNAAQDSNQPRRIVRRNTKKRHREREPHSSITCEWDGCGEHLISMEDFRKHFLKSSTPGVSKHNLPAGNNSKVATICLWGNCQKPISCMWRHLWEVHGEFPRSKRRRL